MKIQCEFSYDLFTCSCVGKKNSSDVKWRQEESEGIRLDGWALTHGMGWPKMDYYIYTHASVHIICMYIIAQRNISVEMPL